MRITTNTNPTDGHIMTGAVVAALHRRFMAWMVDVGVVVAASAAVARTQAETFGPTATLTPGQQGRLEEITGGPSLSWTIGANTRIWAGGGLWTTIAAISLILLLVLALFPANVGGWTPGMRLAGLRIVTVTGDRPRLHHYLIRNLVGVLDLFPFVVPGLLGWIAAWRSPQNQRLGDLAAGTKVVDPRHPGRPADPGTSRSRWTGFPVASTSEPPTEASDADQRELETAARNWAILDGDAELSPAVADTVARTVEDSRSSEPKPLDKVLPPLGRDQRSAPQDEPILRNKLEPQDEPELADELEPQDEPELDGGSYEADSEAEAEDGEAESGEADAAAGTRNTIWSEELEAWTYLDTTSGRWLMHDPDSNRWVPIG